MTIHEDRLEMAVIKYVNSLPLDTLVEWVTNDMWQYYRKSADNEEVLTFIQEMETQHERSVSNTDM